MISFNFVTAVYLLGLHILLLPLIVTIYVKKDWWSLQRKLVKSKNSYPVSHAKIMTDLQVQMKMLKSNKCMADALVKSLERSGKTKPDHSAKPPEPAASLKHDVFFSDHSYFFYI